MMVYEQPPALDLEALFTPLAPLEVQYGLKQPDMLLGALGNTVNFTSEPLGVQAFFKLTPDGLRLDWDAFVQTKHRTLGEFVDLPVDGRTGVFRVVIQETVPQQESGSEGMRTYQVMDPAYLMEDSARIDVRVDSEVGRALSILNWRKTPGVRPVVKTATVELRWKRGQPPELEISRFLCWEFLGIGGELADASE